MHDDPHQIAGYKWLPVIAQDRCTGCALCVDACDHGCLELIWAFATLTRPGDCGSEGTCADVCPEHLIDMAWVAAAGDPRQGRWRPWDNPPVGERSHNGHVSLWRRIGAALGFRWPHAAAGSRASAALPCPPDVP
jgi:NAD-dependent dihydropyrimidine dehydrogenase PreA subunit